MSLIGIGLKYIVKAGVAAAVEHGAKAAIDKGIETVADKFSSKPVDRKRTNCKSCITGLMDCDDGDDRDILTCSKCGETMARYKYPEAK